MAICDNIRTRREALGMTREELAEKTQISFSQLSKIERNEQKNPTIQSIIAISTALNCSVDELIYNKKSTDTNYLIKVINNLPLEDQEVIKKISKGMSLINQAEEMLKKNQ
ncbi:helix-turn-helix transcriptional regulator [Arsenophonus sp.]|uniref:helix-turn-helix domain-containing protein n=1 Tax=Arsenophonus sp. TaxID=1872640 RepID=UPI0028656300|nr:helix-turn-helix transcriptional regulator [Arsenophonus sp.]MDR5617378.1 helix-turn-helix transcriptional regulator [Arsenophonus sp.]MDR5617546.1 helix-turn-helix transcriptional regulator [Arsenophonus sp.]MDR5617785.1 helix-turn-helix transcriptional regulator [Arsenophonus sp.]MDR5617796.1 helix-turn-helix transcriptional regulator [Arsenophonus sp.]MDR5617969.1 helix-turn-helix transcriptional regulator [Arsenophonus sp.]